MLIGKLAGIFTSLAVIMCCLVLFGLTAYLIRQRTKEIGIRKVMGASISEVLLLITKDFIVLVIISCMFGVDFGDSNFIRSLNTILVRVS